MSLILNIAASYPASATTKAQQTYERAADALQEHSPSNASTESPADVVEFSPLGRALAPLAERSTFRIAQIRAIRSEIQNGTYETPARIAGTVSRLLDVLG